MGLSLKSLLPIAGAAAGYFFGGPAGSAAMNAALGSGIGTLAAGGDATDAVKNAILAGGSGSLLGTAGVPGAGAAQSATGVAATEAAKQKVYQDAVMREAAKQTATTEAAKQGILGTGITGGDIFLGSSLLGLLEKPEDISDDFDASDLESRPDYEGKPIAGLFVDRVTGQAYDTVEELEAAVQERQNNNSEELGIAALAAGGYIRGPGTGTSDSIKAGIYQNGQKVQEARLSDQEFVMTKKAVEGAGNGDPDAGAKRMYALMDKFERMA
jgi:hypothetical protein